MFQRILRLLMLSLLACALLAACATAPTAATEQNIQSDTAVASDTPDTSSTAASSVPTAPSTAATVMAENTVPTQIASTPANTADAVQITLAGSTISASGGSVTTDGSTATITAAGSYSLSGVLNDGQIVVDSEDAEPVQLILNGVSISSSTSAPIYVKGAGSVELVLADGTENTLSDAAEYVYASADEDEPNAALFSDDLLTISGTGSLLVQAHYNDGIASKDGLVIHEGTITVEAADDGIRGKDYLLIQGGIFTITSGGDGLKSDNDEDATLGYISIEDGSFEINAGGDGVQAETDLVVTTGSFEITTAGGHTAMIGEDASAKGLKSGVHLTIDTGSFSIDAADDGIHSNGEVSINTGSFIIESGDDAIHSDTSLTVNDGNITIPASVEGLEGFTITINDGNIALVASDDGVNAAGDEPGAATTEDTATADPAAGAAQGGTTPEGGTPPEGMGQGGTPPEGWTPPEGGMPQGGPGGMGGGMGRGGNQSLTINGGTLVVNAQGDGLDSNGSITMTGGVVIVHGPTQNGNGALDYDGSFTLSGGLLIAAGSSGMAQVSGDASTQNAVLINLDAAQSAGTLVHIQNSAGEDMLTFAPLKDFQSIAFSSAELASGETYTVFLGGTATGSAVDGLYTDASYSGGSQYTEFTVSSAVTQVGTGGGFGGPGGRP